MTLVNKKEAAVWC